jgi:hypothetical protein
MESRSLIEYAPHCLMLRQFWPQTTNDVLPISADAG